MSGFKTVPAPGPGLHGTAQLPPLQATAPTLRPARHAAAVRGVGYARLHDLPGPPEARMPVKAAPADLAVPARELSSTGEAQARVAMPDDPESDEQPYDDPPADELASAPRMRPRLPRGRASRAGRLDGAAGASDPDGAAETQPPRNARWLPLMAALLTVCAALGWHAMRGAAAQAPRVDPEIARRQKAAADAAAMLDALATKSAAARAAGTSSGGASSATPAAAQPSPLATGERADAQAVPAESPAAVPLPSAEAEGSPTAPQAEGGALPRPIPSPTADPQLRAPALADPQSPRLLPRAIREIPLPSARRGSVATATAAAPFAPIPMRIEGTAPPEADPLAHVPIDASLHPQAIERVPFDLLRVDAEAFPPRVQVRRGGRPGEEGSWITAGMPLVPGWTLVRVDRGGIDLLPPGGELVRMRAPDGR